MAKKSPSKSKSSAKSELTYEQIRAKLEKVVGKLEEGEASLEDSLALYEEGVQLVRAAHGILDSIEKKLEVLKPRADGTYDLADGSSIAGEDGE